MAESNELYFSYYNSAERDDGGLVLDSGATCSMILDTILFVGLDKSFSETMENGNKKKTKDLSKGRVEFFLKNSWGNSKKSLMSD